MSVATYIAITITTWQQGKEMINTFSYVLGLGETSSNTVHVIEIVTFIVLVCSTGLGYWRVSMLCV
jgi:hypothetical protein